jgi:hypothetical protein
VATEAPLPPPPFRESRAALRVVVVVVIVAAVALTFLVVVPVPQTASTSWGYGTSGTGLVHFDFEHPESLCPSGGTARVSFSSSGVTTSASIDAPNGTRLVSDNATGWIATFPVAVCGDYEFDVAGSGDGSLSFSVQMKFDAPLL